MARNPERNTTTKKTTTTSPLTLSLTLLALTLWTTTAPTCPNQKNTQATKRWQTFILYLEETPCYGTCPIYKVWLTSKGIAYWQGIRFVPLEGPGTATLTPEQTDTIRQWLASIHWDTLKNEYVDRNIQDLPGWHILVQDHYGNQKHIHLYGTTRTIPRHLLEKVQWLQAWILKLPFQPADSLPEDLPQPPQNPPAQQRTPQE